LFGPALRKAWDLLRARYVFGYLLHGDQEWTEFEIVLPPTTLLGSANAGCIFDGLWCTGFASKLAQYSKNMHENSVHRFSTRAKDRGSAAEKFSAWEGSTRVQV